MNYIQVLDLIYGEIPKDVAPSYTMSNETDYSTLVWSMNSSTCKKPSKEFLDGEIIRFTSRYAEFRKRKYPTIEEWILALLQKEIDGQSEEWDQLVMKRQAIKDKYPKPE